MRKLFILVLSSFSLLALDAQEALVQPERLLRLREQWTLARQRAISPIDLKYKQELSILLQEFTRAGKLDEALAVRSEIAALEQAGPSNLSSPSSSAESRLSMPDTKGIETNAENSSKGFEFDGQWSIIHYSGDKSSWTGKREVKDKVVIDHDKRELKWQRNGNVIRIDWPNNGFEEIVIDQTNHDRLEGVRATGERVAWKRLN